jgi:hypothetical protein
VDMSEVYVRIKAARKEQLAIHLWHMKERFGGLTLRKKGCACTQHGVPTDYLADMDGLNVRHHQPRSHGTRGWKTNLSLNISNTWRSNSRIWGITLKPLITRLSNMGCHDGNGFRNPSTKC